MKEYRQTDSEQQAASEPAMSYGSTYLQGLKQRLKTTIDKSNDEESLQECIELLYSDSMPCVFSEEELTEEIKLSEKSGEATDEEVELIFKKWID